MIEHRRALSRPQALFLATLVAMGAGVALIGFGALAAHQEAERIRLAAEHHAVEAQLAVTTEILQDSVAQNRTLVQVLEDRLAQVETLGAEVSDLEQSVATLRRRLAARSAPAKRAPTRRPPSPLRILPTAQTPRSWVFPEHPSPGSAKPVPVATIRPKARP